MNEIILPFVVVVVASPVDIERRRTMYHAHPNIYRYCNQSCMLARKDCQMYFVASPKFVELMGLPHP